MYHNELVDQASLINRKKENSDKILFSNIWFSSVFPLLDTTRDTQCSSFAHGCHPVPALLLFLLVVLLFRLTLSNYAYLYK